MDVKLTGRKCVDKAVPYFPVPGKGKVFQYRIKYERQYSLQEAAGQEGNFAILLRILGSIRLVLLMEEGDELLDFLQSFWIQGVVDELSIAEGVYKASFAQNSQVLGGQGFFPGE
jgi:hypothetical protein